MNRSSRVLEVRRTGRATCAENLRPPRGSVLGGCTARNLCANFIRTCFALRSVLCFSLSLPRVRVQKEKIMWRTSSSEKNKSRFPFQLFCYVLYYYIGTTIYDQSMMHAGLNMTSRCCSSISFLRDSFAFLTESNPDTSFALVALRLFSEPDRIARNLFPWSHSPP